MGLEILAQHPVVRDGEDPYYSWSGSTWVDGVGFVGNWTDGDTWFYGAVQLDGELIYIDRKPSASQSARANYQLDFLTGRLLIHMTYVFGYTWVTDAETNIWDPFVVDWGTVTPNYNARVIRLNDRWLKVRDRSVYWAPLDLSQDWALEHEFTGAGFSSYPSVSDGGGGALWFAYDNGYLAKYDTGAKQLIDTNLNIWKFGTGGYTTRGTWWSKELNVFVSLVRDSDGADHIWTFSSEVRPFSLSDPVALGDLKRGYVTMMEVELKGDSDEPVADFPVDWTITAGTGSLANSQTLTDSEGKAKVGYLPDDLASSSFTLKAEVAY